MVEVRHQHEDARQDRSGAAASRRRQYILNTAAHLFAENGYQGTSLRQIAGACDLKQGHLYYYYPTKQLLLFEIVDRLQQRYNNLLGTIVMTDAEPEIRLRELLRSHVALICEFTVETTVSHEGFKLLSPEYRERLVSSRDAYEAGIRDLIEQCRHTLPVDDTSTHVLSKVVLGIVNWPYRWFRAEGSTDAAELADTLSRRAMASLLTCQNL